MLKLNKKGQSPEKKETPEELAKKAVEAFEDKRSEWIDAKREWEGSFPEARQALDGVKKLEDDVGDAIKAAKSLVAAAGVSVGEFKATVPWSRETYNGAGILSTVAALDDESAGRIIKELFTTGMVTDMSVDPDVAKIVVGRDSDLKKLLEPAFKPSEQLTVRVTVPKL